MNNLNEKIVELAERITIDYANLSGRESANRSEFREGVLKHLRQFAQEITAEMLVEEKKIMENRTTDEKRYPYGYNQCLQDIKAKRDKLLNL